MKNLSIAMWLDVTHPAFNAVVRCNLTLLQAFVCICSQLPGRSRHFHNNANAGAFRKVSPKGDFVYFTPILSNPRNFSLSLRAPVYLP